MRLFGITRIGLIALSLSVFALWGCIATGAVIRSRAARDEGALLRQMRQLQRNVEPVRSPVRVFAEPVRPASS